MGPEAPDWRPPLSDGLDVVDPDDVDPDDVDPDDVDEADPSLAGVFPSVVDFDSVGFFDSPDPESDFESEVAAFLRLASAERLSVL